MTGADSQRRRRGIFVETQPNQSPAPSGAAYSGSLVERFENVLRIEFHPESLQQLGVFLPKRFSGMMLLLVLNVTNHRAEL